MSNRQLIESCKKQKEERRLKIELLERAKKVNDLFFYNKQKIDYPNAISFYTPQNYQSLVQTEADLNSKDINIERGIAETNLIKFVSDSNVAVNILGKLSDEEVLLFNAYFDSFSKEVRLNLKKAVGPEIFLDYIKKFLSKYSFSLTKQMNTTNVVNNTNNTNNTNNNPNNDPNAINITPNAVHAAPIGAHSSVRSFTKDDYKIYIDKLREFYEPFNDIISSEYIKVLFTSLTIMIDGTPDGRNV